MSSLKKIRVEALRPGMYLHDICGSWLEHPFWRTSFLIEDGRHVRRLGDSGIHEVWIDTARGFDVDAPDTPTLPDLQIEPIVAVAAPRTAPVERASLAEELTRAHAICGRSKAAVVAMFKDARLGKAIFADQAKPVVDDIVGSVLRHPCALISLARLKFADHDTFLHSVAVSALMVALGRQLGLDDDTLHEVGLGGLLHDIGKITLAPHILTKPGRLADAEYLAIKGHPADGQRILLNDIAIGPIALDICLHHHEKLDGSGYPVGLKGDQISIHARMSAVCDVYDAITADRCYRGGWNPGEAVRKMQGWCPHHLDQRIFHAFVQTVGIYPVGALVRLRSEHLAVVVDQAEKSVLTPVVNLFFSIASNRKVPPQRVELAFGIDAIVSLEDPRDWRLGEPDAIWRLVEGAP